MVFKILRRKNGQRTISDSTGNDTIKVTKMLEFLTDMEPKNATIGSIVRFMWNPGNGTSLCWLQGEVEARVDPYKKARGVDWKTNKVKVKDLKVATYWGDDCPKKLPKTMVVNLSRKNAWALGTEVTLDTKEEDEGLEVELSDIPAVSEDFDDDETETREEKGAAGGIEIMEPNENENNP